MGSTVPYHKGPSKKIVHSMGLLCYYFAGVITKNNSLKGLFCSFIYVYELHSNYVYTMLARL